MRISTITSFRQSMDAMVRQQSDFLKLGLQISSGQRVLTPSEDPQSASAAVAMEQSLALNEQFSQARVSSRNLLSQEDNVLGQVSDVLSTAKSLLVQASNGTLNDTDRISVASELNGLYETLIGQANVTDGNGRYLFGGTKDKSAPFVRQDGHVVYVGDTGQPAQQVDSSRQIANGDHGEQVFMTVHGSSGYLAKANPDNQGNVTFSGPSMVSGTTAAFNVQFAVDGDAITYSTDEGGSWQAYTSGMSIESNGLLINLQGTPANGDSIDIVRASDANPNIFRTFESTLAALNAPAADAQAQAQLKNLLSTSMRELDGALDNVLTTRASVGARLNELDLLDKIGSNRELNYKQTLSDLVDLDYYEAISSYTMRIVGLQAAQKSFVDLQQLSIFDYMK